MMWDRPVIGLLPDGKRLRLREGPIDLIVEASGAPGEITEAYRQAVRAFRPLLGQLSAELPALRAPVSEAHKLQSSTARAMQNAARQFCGDAFASPMIAVAGAVADHVLAAMLEGRSLTRAYVNNGGDIALHLTPGAGFTVGLCPEPETVRIAATTTLMHADGVGGIATSGWRGRSHSLGIADAVTVLARSAAHADAAATMIANAVDLPAHPAVTRVPARDLSPDSDLGARPVTTAVGPLSTADVRAALNRGAALAGNYLSQGRIIAAHGALRSETFTAERAQSCLTS